MPDPPHRDGPRWSRYGLRSVAILYMSLLVIVPVAMVGWRTFEHGLQPFLDALSEPSVLRSFRLTAMVAGVAVVLNTVFGVGVSLLLVRYRFPGRRALSAVIDLSLSVSPVVIGLALILVYGRTGWLGAGLEDAGVKVIFATPGMILATTIVSLPLVIREVVPVLEEIGIEQEQAAQSLGAGGWQTFRRITLPSIKWAVAYGVVLSLARSLGEFGAVKIVSGNLMNRTQTATLLIEQRYQDFDQPTAYAASFVLASVAVICIIAISIIRPKEHS